MNEFIYTFGYFGLFIISFLASTLLPLSSEVVVISMAALGYDLWLITLFATAGNFLGSLVNYYVGRKGSQFIFSRYIQIDPTTWAKAERFYKRWGVIALFFSWVPIIGDPLTAVAGAFHINLRVFTFWVILGKALRYLLLLGLAQHLFS
ncbi:MAG: DedA family protein [Chloroflexi bacterium]|nr:MAG: DedA family protein [Chloroflexota bacterium]